MNKPTPCVACALVSRSRVLTVKQGKTWALPRAIIRSGLQPYNAAQELMEEVTGKTYDNISVSGLVSEKRDVGRNQSHNLVHVCIIKLKGKLKLTAQMKWQHFGKPVDMDLVDAMILEHMIAKKEGTYYDCIVQDDVVQKFSTL